MRYEGEVRWRFKGDPGLCSRYIPQARTFCGFTMSLQGDGVETYKRRQTLADKAKIKVLKYPAMVPIIEIDVLGVEASEAPKLRGFILRPWENDHVDAISGADKELVLSYRDRTPNSYYTFWPSKDTPEYGQARENYAYLPNFPSGFSKFGNVLWTNGKLSCSIHGPQLRYWRENSLSNRNYDAFYEPESATLEFYRDDVFSCGRQIYDISSPDAVANDPYKYGNILSAALRDEDGQTWLFMCRSSSDHFVICSYKVVESTSTSDTHMVDCATVRTHVNVAFSNTGIRPHPISAWVFNASCTAVSALFDSIDTYYPDADNIEVFTNNPSMVVTFSGGSEDWTSVEHIKAPSVSVGVPYDTLPVGNYTVGISVETGGSASCEVTGIVVAVDYDGDELIEMTVDYSESYESDTMLSGDYYTLPGTPRCSGSNLYAALAYISGQSASGYVSALHPTVTDPDEIADLEENYQNYIDSVTAQIEDLIAQHESMVAGYPSLLALQEETLAAKSYTSYIKRLRRHAKLNFRGHSTVLEDLDVSVDNGFVPNVRPYIALNPQGGYGLCTVVNIGMPETQCPGGVGQRMRNFFPSVSEGEAFYSLGDGFDGPPSGVGIRQYSVAFVENHFAVNDCQYLISYTYSLPLVGTSTHINSTTFTTTTRPINYELQKVIAIDARLDTAALARHEHTYNTPHYMYLPNPDGGLWQHYTDTYPVANMRYSEGRIRTAVRTGVASSNANWFVWNNDELIDVGLGSSNRTDGLEFPSPPTGLLWTRNQQPNSSARWAIFHFVLHNLFTWSVTRTQDLLNERVERDESATISGYGDHILSATFSYGDDIAISWLSGGTDPNQQTGFSPQVRMYPSSFFPKYIIEGER